VLLARHARRRAPHAVCYNHPGRCAESRPERPRAASHLLDVRSVKVRSTRMLRTRRIVMRRRSRLSIVRRNHLRKSLGSTRLGVRWLIFRGRGRRPSPCCQPFGLIVVGISRRHRVARDEAPVDQPCGKVLGDARGHVGSCSRTHVSARAGSCHQFRA
jgi:hypothetical protein